MVEAAPAVSQEQLQMTFTNYCGAGQTTMDGKGFAKMAKDTKLLDKKLTTTDVDMTFAKVKDRTARRINFQQFMAGLDAFAQKKACGVDAIYAKVAASQGPILAGTKADAVRFHDDKDQYTGVYAHGGPSTVDANRQLDGLLDRSDADVRGVKTGAANVAAVTHQVAGIHITEESKGAVGGAKKGKKKTGGAAAASASAAAASQPASNLQEVFTEYAAGKEMDGKTFAKLMKDCKLTNKECKPTDIDLIFAKVKDKSARKINFNQFKAALVEVGKKHSNYDMVEQSILQHGGPTFAGTQADAVRFHDDKDQYTGVYAHGGPSTVGGTGGVSDISQLCDRTDANVRGVKR